MIEINILNNLHRIFKEDPKQAFQISLKMLKTQSFLISELQDCLLKSSQNISAFKSCLHKILQVCRKIHNDNSISIDHFDILNLIDSVLLKEVDLNDLVHISADLETSEAAALSQFLKRIGFTEIRMLTASDEEAYDAQGGADKIRRSLEESGYNPR